MEKEQFVDPKNGFTEEYREVLTKLEKIGECPAPFCKETDWNHETRPSMVTDHWKVYENAYNSKGAQHKFLIVLREHLTDFAKLSLEAWIDLRQIKRALDSQYVADGSTLIFRTNATNYTGATVNHLHAQLIIGCARDDETDTTKPITITIGFQPK